MIFWGSLAFPGQGAIYLVTMDGPLKPTGTGSG